MSPTTLSKMLVLVNNLPDTTVSAVLFDLGMRCRSGFEQPGPHAKDIELEICGMKAEITAICGQ